MLAHEILIWKTVDNWLLSSLLYIIINAFNSIQIRAQPKTRQAHVSSHFA